MESGTGVLEWKAVYKAALLETDAGKIPKLITEAERAVMNRMSGVGLSVTEKQSLTDALTVLRDLRRITQDGV